MLGRSLERDLDDIVPVLLKKAGELSTAGVGLAEKEMRACTRIRNAAAWASQRVLTAMCSPCSGARAPIIYLLPLPSPPPGRDNFLATEADRALSAVCSCVSEARALAALLAAGLGHKSPHVRCRAAAHLDEVAAGGAGLEGVAASNWALTDRLFKCAAGAVCSCWCCCGRQPPVGSASACKTADDVLRACIACCHCTTCRCVECLRGRGSGSSS